MRTWVAAPIAKNILLASIVDCLIEIDNEKDNKCILIKSGLSSDNDNTKCKISGDFTYNVDNALIITYCVYDGVIDLPMCTLNLGEWNDVYNNINDFSKCKIPNDLLLTNDKISIVPEVKIPSFDKVEFISFKNFTIFGEWFKHRQFVFCDSIFTFK